MPKLYDALPVVITSKAGKKNFALSIPCCIFYLQNVIHIYIYIYIPDVSGGIANISGGGSMDYSE